MRRRYLLVSGNSLSMNKTFRGLIKEFVYSSEQKAQTSAASKNGNVFCKSSVGITEDGESGWRKKKKVCRRARRLTVRQRDRGAANAHQQLRAIIITASTDNIITAQSAGESQTHSAGIQRRDDPDEERGRRPPALCPTPTRQMGGFVVVVYKKKNISQIDPD